MSPKFGPKSIYNDLINKAFIYSIDFFRQNYLEFLDECGMFRAPRNKGEKETCDGYAKNSSFWESSCKNGTNGYFCDEAATISPLSTILKMINGCDLYENIGDLDFFYQDNYWQVGELSAKHLVLATGSKLLVKDEPYLKIKPIFGEKLEAKSDNGTDYHLHRSCSISAKRDGRIFIGATHIPSWRFEDSEELFELHRQKLIDEASLLLGETPKIIGIYGGFRSSTTDYFPIVGEVINSSQTLKIFPAIYHGVNVSSDRFVYHKNLWIHGGHGARGFVLAPYTAKQLYLQMFEPDTKVADKEIMLSRQFIRYARKLGSKISS